MFVKNTLPDFFQILKKSSAPHFAKKVAKKWHCAPPAHPSMRMGHALAKISKDSHALSIILRIFAMNYNGVICPYPNGELIRMTIDLNNQKILITGASGFIGSFMVERALELGAEVWAAMRPSSSRAYLQDPRIHFINLNFNDSEALTAQLTKFAEEASAWDYVIHAAGVTKCQNVDDFYKTNAEGTARFAQALLQTNTLRKRFVFVSSLSVWGAVHEDDYADISENDIPHPNTDYGKSKLEAECLLAEMSELDYVILRPTGVYGPREKDYFLMAKSICGHVDFAVGYQRQDITFVYVRDVVEASMLALQHGRRGRGYFLSDGNVYSSSDFSKLLQKELNVKFVLPITAPIWVLRIVCWLSGWLSKLTGKPTALNMDKFNILKQRNWRCDIAPAKTDLGYAPRYDLERGVKETVAWYKQAGWL